MATTLFYDVTFESAHFLPHVPEGHRCRRLHGHNYRAEIELSGEVDPKLGWIIDFYDVERLCAPVLEQIDHRLLNDVPGLENPTAENIAAWWYAKLKPNLAQLCAIVVHETAGSRCRYAP